ncbi:MULTISPECIES: LacI family DNA-binding transcriptional regulator [Rhodococcus]|uniref:LacI family DNA-binding transcriptional regulator n=1 Tax=Rhodococcus TaxID=1827 RepID=UPI001205B3A7|nr:MULTISPECIES: LacI family DNA-binding transcriptional regulator [Rhodococcus]QXW01291.1 LacI family DNA-binding transcriptional regulator [Rhodococcus globerulus]RZL24619.1 MAG: LacI family DNA-binding transcriptional regulator [Rhodococcus sp. (in: high G+C Gram-positive bacteria)]
MATTPGIRDVAALCGVSVATVSQILNGRRLERYSDETQRLVHESAVSIGYKPNSFARGLRTQRSGVIGMVSNQIVTTPYAGKLVLGAQHAAQRAGLVLMVVNSEGNADAERRAIQSLMQHQVDGVLYAALVKQVVHVPAILDNTITTVVHGLPTSTTHPSVVSDERQGAHRAVRHLLDHGHRRIGFVTTTEDLVAAVERLMGYRDALAGSDVQFDPTLVKAGETNPASARHAAMELLDRSDRPTAIFCFSDHMAMGVYQAANILNLRIPEDLSIVGFGDLELISAGLMPQLSTVAIPYFEMGAAAVQSVLDRVGKSERDIPTPSQVLLPCNLVVRESVAAPAGRV